MADQKITELTANSTPAEADLVVTVDDPSGTPVTTKTTVGELGDVVVNETRVVGAIDGSTLTDIGTPASGDKVLLRDASDSNSLKEASFSEFGALSVAYQSTAPSSPGDGDLWVDTSEQLDLPVTSASIRSIVALTQAAYDALGSYDSETLYYITD